MRGATSVIQEACVCKEENKIKGYTKMGTEETNQER